MTGKQKVTNSMTMKTSKNWTKQNLIYDYIIMNYVTGFLDNLSNTYTTVLIAFLLGYMVGLTKLSDNRTLYSILIGIMFAVIAGIIISFIEIVMPQNITIVISTKLLFTIMLIIAFVALIPSINE